LLNGDETRQLLKQGFKNYDAAQQSKIRAVLAATQTVGKSPPNGRNGRIVMKSKDRISLLQISHFLAVGLLLVLPASARAQTVVATIPVGAGLPRAVAVNPVTNKIYVASCTANSPTFRRGSLTVIDGATNATTVINGCFKDVAVDSVTNKIYVPSAVIDGATNAVTNLSAGGNVVAVNPLTNKIYVANRAGYTYVIDGATNSITTVIDPNALYLNPAAIAVNPVTNKIYVANNALPFSNPPGNVTVIDGATNSTTTLTDPNAIIPQFVAVNPVTNKIYVANAGNLGDYPPGLNHGNITVIDGSTNAITTLTDPNVLVPQAVAVNQTTNKIYVAIPDDSALTGNGGVAVIDGATNAISIVKDPNAIYPKALAVDSASNTIYVTNQGNNQQNVNPCCNPGSVTVIKGATNAVATVINPNAAQPGPAAINPTTNKIYVLNGGGNVTVIDGGATPTSHLLSVLLAGNESGTVTSNPAGVNCGTSCTASFAPGTAVNLTASPAPGATFSRWNNACTGAGSCNLTLNSDDFVTATFGSPGDFSVEPASLNLTAQRGGQVTDVITIAPLIGSFTTAVQLSCAVTPSPLNPSTALATCSLSPTSVTPGANSATSTLTVTAPAQSAELIPSGGAPLSWPLYAVFLPVSLALVGLGLADGKSRNGRRSLWLLCSLFIAFGTLQMGCGGSSSNQPPPPPPPTLNYTVTVTATSGALQHTNLVNVAVQ
jgi:DNA-binding beta-propeller fold protein YncE